jgi:aromatic ring-cleaving dioxygenase
MKIGGITRIFTTIPKPAGAPNGCGTRSPAPRRRGQRIERRAEGPHPVPQFRFAFTAAQFEKVVPWLMLNRDNLDVLVHPLTDNSYDDHSRYAVWLGAPVALRLNTMRRSYRAEQYPTPHQSN